MTDLYAVESDKGLSWFVWFFGRVGFAHLEGAFEFLDAALEFAAGLQSSSPEGEVSICEGSALVLSRGPLA